MRRTTKNITEDAMNKLGWSNSKSKYEIDKGIYFKKCDHMRYWLDLRDLNNVSLNFSDDSDSRRFVRGRYKFTRESIEDNISSIETIMSKYDICLSI
jgi:hypothetical protein